MYSSTLERRPKRTSPHGSDVVGNSLFFTSARAAGENKEGSTLLFMNGGRSVTAPRVLQAADETVVKSPASIAGVGMKARLSDGVDRRVVPWVPAKKNSLLCRIGPPMVPPN